MNIEVSENNIFKRFHKDLIEHQWALPSHEENDE
jgi:hypothetical protein